MSILNFIFLFFIYFFFFDSCIDNYFSIKKDYGNAVKKREKDISILKKVHNENADRKTANLLSNLYNNKYLPVDKTRK